VAHGNGAPADGAGSAEPHLAPVPVGDLAVGDGNGSADVNGSSEPPILDWQFSMEDEPGGPPIENH
jgi:hypothetical protein